MTIDGRTDRWTGSHSDCSAHLQVVQHSHAIQAQLRLLVSITLKSVSVKAGQEFIVGEAGAAVQFFGKAFSPVYRFQVISYPGHFVPYW